MAQSEKGRLITLEGGEGAGKSTQALALQARLAGHGVDALLTREPGGTPGGELIRKLLVTGDTGRWEPMTEALLHYGARKEHLEKIIRPALAKGQWVISDRFADSTMAYQGYAQGLGQDIIARLADLVLEGFEPDLTIVLDIPWEVGLRRAEHRSDAASVSDLQEDRYERMTQQFHERLGRAFRAIVEANKHRCVLIDGRKPLGEIEDQIWTVVDFRFLKPGKHHG